MVIDIIVLIVLVSLGVGCYALGRRFIRAAGNRAQKIKTRIKR